MWYLKNVNHFAKIYMKISKRIKLKLLFLPKALTEPFLNFGQIFQVKTNVIGEWINTILIPLKLILDRFIRLYYYHKIYITWKLEQLIWE